MTVLFNALKVIKISFVGFLLSVLLTGISRSEEERYLSLFYPNGMPVRKGWDGKERQTKYDFYSEVVLSSNNRVVLFSEKLITGYSDDLFKVFIGLISDDKGKSELRVLVDVTEFIDVYVEERGNFYRMNGVLNQFNINDETLGVHVNLWAVISGSGAQSSASDLFYSFNKKEPILKAILTLTGTDRFSRSGGRIDEDKKTAIYIADLDQDLYREIIVAEKEYKTDKVDKNKHIFSEDVKVYKYADGIYNFNHSLKEVPKGVSLLTRVDK